MLCAHAAHVQQLPSAYPRPQGVPPAPPVSCPTPCRPSGGGGHLGTIQKKEGMHTPTVAPYLMTPTQSCSTGVGIVL